MNSPSMDSDLTGLTPALSTKVARGQHEVPGGVAVLEFLDGEYDKIAKANPEVKKLLEYRQLQYVFKYFATRLCKKGKTYIYTKGGRYWIESKLVEVVQEFQKDFSKKRVRLSLCILYSDCGHYRWFWLEFIDPNIVPDSYKSKYDVSDYKLVLKNMHMVPNQGVVVHHLEDSDAKKFMNKTPDEVKAMLEPKGLLKDYEFLTKSIYESSTTRTWTDSWKTHQVFTILKQLQKPFQDKGIELAVCKRPIGSGDSCKWIEIIDTSVAPSDHFPVYTVDPDHLRSNKRMSASTSTMSFNVFVMQNIVVDGQSIPLAKCPAELAELLEQKGLTDQYHQLEKTIAASRSLRNFCDLWRLTEQGLVSFAPVVEYKQKFESKGIRLVLCESAGRLGRNYWLEYVDTEHSPNYSSPFNVVEDKVTPERLGLAKTKKVLDGRHRVPTGVEVEELTDAKTLTECCTPSVLELLEPKGLVETYNKCMKAIATSKASRNVLGQWHSAEIANVIQEFANEFAAQGVQVAMCKMKTSSEKSIRWFEFIDIVKADGYVPQYDVTNFGEEVEAGHIKLQFPKGVAVQKLMDRKNVMESMPPLVKKLMDTRQCEELYDSLVDLICKSILGPDEQLDEATAKEMVITLGPRFEEDGVSVYLSYKSEAGGGAGKELFWVEFVDREAQPNYTAQHGMRLLKLPTKSMPKEELMSTITAAAAALEDDITSSQYFGS